MKKEDTPKGASQEVEKDMEKSNGESICQEPCLTNDSEELTKIQNKLADKEDAYIRLMAEYDNYRKRTLKEKAELIRNAGESVLNDLLPIIDDFERGLQNIEKATDIDALKEGMVLIYQKFTSYLERNGVKAILTENEAFDDNFHEAITSIPAPAEALKGKVIDCTKKGYTLNDKVIRFAQVVVGE